MLGSQREPSVLVGGSIVHVPLILSRAHHQSLQAAPLQGPPMAQSLPPSGFIGQGGPPATLPPGGGAECTLLTNG